jgi:hypothetical protein
MLLIIVATEYVGMRMALGYQSQNVTADRSGHDVCNPITSFVSQQQIDYSCYEVTGSKKTYAP